MSGQPIEDWAPGLERAFELDVVEGAWNLVPEGEIPRFVRGDYYLNGPSRFRVGDIAYRHWLDGDGAVSRLAFGTHTEDGTVRFVHRFVDSRKRRDEAEANRALYRTFGTAFPGDRLKKGIALESPVNVSVFRFGDDLLAFGEQGLPYALDPHTLATRGEHTFDGRLNAISPLSAHPCFEASSGDMLNFGMSFSARQPSMTLYRFARDGELLYRRRHPLPYPCSTHDFVLSGSYAILYLSPHVLDVGRLMDAQQSIDEALCWQPELGSRLMLFDHNTGDAVADIEVGRGYCLHLINAYEDDQRLIVDLVELERPVYDQYSPVPDLFVDAPAGGPRRFVIDRETWTVIERDAIHYDVCPDFPAIHPSRGQRSYNDFWLLGMSHQGRTGRKFFDQVAHLRWDQPDTVDAWTAPGGWYLGGEPVVLPDPEHDDRACVLCQAFHAAERQSQFLIFDAFRVGDGPIARLYPPHPMPLGFHASFQPE